MIQLLLFFLQKIVTAAESLFPIFVQYSAAAYCTAVVNNHSFDCGIPCSGSINDTIVYGGKFDLYSSGAGYVAYNKRTSSIIVAFRGSQPGNVLFDLEFWETTAPSFIETINRNALVHTGFQDTYMRIRQDMLNLTYRLSQMYPDYSITFTGHSLGGSLATFAAAEFNHLYGNDSRISLYTYGLPRTGNSDFAMYIDNLPFKDRIFRLTRYGDPVPRLPFELLQYKHYKTQYGITNDNQVFKCPVIDDYGDNPDCMNDTLHWNITNHNKYFGWPKHNTCVHF